MLVDLERSIESCQRNYQSRAFKGEVRLTNEFIDIFKKYHTSCESIHPNNYSILIITKEKRRVEFPSTWFWYALDFHPYWSALSDYKDFLTKVRSETKKLGAPTKADTEKVFLKTLPSSDWESDIKNTSWAQPFTDAINNISHSRNEAEFFIRFISEPKWWNKSVDDKEASYKRLDRGDAIQSSLEAAMGVLSASSSWLHRIIDDFSKHPELKSAFENLSTNQVNDLTENYTAVLKEKSTKPAEVGINKIFYGAPGTGKSHKIKKLTQNTKVIRTVFHSETQYTDFVGCLKPSTDEKGDINYSFRPGAFINALCDSVNDEEHQYFLIIEEINRAPAAAVFGEIFQLLDRNHTTGKSEYDIDISDPEMLRFLRKNTNDKFKDGKLFIPSNLTILATMNSSDQAVMPLDTAFKRRWSFEYIPLDFSKKCADGEITIFEKRKQEKIVSWATFATSINKVLSSMSSPIPEDRHLGPWFLSSEELKNDSKGVLTGKLFVYLWDDVLRHGLTDELFLSDIKTYGNLVKRQNEKLPVFNSTFLSALENTEI